ncbi:MAG: DUF4350 domain-containing protein [Clostridiales bacterium]|nr:DUF4350 domain-containing protein [Clostridiales bacterium]
MKKSNRKEIFIVAVLFAVFIIITVLTSTDKGLGYPDYTSFSASENGVSLLYDTLEEMGYPVAVDTNYITENTDITGIQVVVNPDTVSTSSDNIEDIAKWTENGGHLMYFTDSETFFEDPLLSYMYPEFDSNYRINEGFSARRYGSGALFYCSANSIININLMGNPDNGQDVCDFADAFADGRLYFNEAYHGYATAESFFDSLPFGLKIMFYQIIIITIAVVFYFGKRFGRPLPYYEEIEREENEYVYTLSNLYMSTGMGGAALSAYEEKLKDSARRFFKFTSEPTYAEILAEWNARGLDGSDKLAFIMGYVDRETDKIIGVNTKKREGRKTFEKLSSSYKYLIKLMDITKL